MAVKDKNGRRLLWVVRCVNYNGRPGGYQVSPTRMTRARNWNIEDKSVLWSSAQGIAVCSTFMHACTGVKLEAGADPVQMEVSLVEFKP